MSIADLRELYDYAYWANAKFLAVIATLTPDEFTRDVSGSYGSIRNTLVHALSAEAGWLDRCGGPARGPKLEPADFPTIESVTAAWSRTEAQMRAFLNGLSDNDLAQPVEFELGSGGKRSMAKGQLLRHAAIHGVHHRGQVALLLRGLGHSPGNVDMLFYYAPNRGN